MTCETTACGPVVRSAERTCRRHVTGAPASPITSRSNRSHSPLRSRTSRWRSPTPAARIWSTVANPSCDANSFDTARMPQCPTSTGARRNPLARSRRAVLWQISVCELERSGGSATEREDGPVTCGRADRSNAGREPIAATAPAVPLPNLVLLVRHGATEWSETGRHTGRTDLPLTDLGMRQASAVGPLIVRLLDGAEPLVFTSPLQRAAQTAALAIPRYEAIHVDALMEYDYGQYEGKTSSEILAIDPAWNLFTTGCPGGEGPHQVAARCDAFAAKLERTATGRAVVAFTHGHLSRILTARLLGLPGSAGAALYNETASVGVINVHRGRWVLVGWNIEAI